MSNDDLKYDGMTDDELYNRPQEEDPYPDYYLTENEKLQMHISSIIQQYETYDTIAAYPFLENKDLFLTKDSSLSIEEAINLIDKLCRVDLDYILRLHSMLVKLNTWFSGKNYMSLGQETLMSFKETLRQRAVCDAEILKVDPEYEDSGKYVWREWSQTQDLFPADTKFPEEDEDYIPFF